MLPLWYIENAHFTVDIDLALDSDSIIDPDIKVNI